MLDASTNTKECHAIPMPMHPRRHLAFARGTSSFTNNDDYITAAMQPWVHSGWTLTSTAGVDSQLLLFCSRP
jgi:hypothetical protein